ncbi:MAG: AMP-binding protein [Bacteroidetes bacterium]|jgi:long-chain acyl-CoA synthetase|nr:AMP-binding protein [Bacteroidota bacterium]
MERIWQAQYPKGVARDIDPNRYASVVDFFLKSCEKFADRPAFTHMGRTLSYRQLEQESRKFAAYLQQHTSLKPGDRIALQMPNLLQYPVIMFGAMRAGLILVNTNPLYTEREMQHQFADAGVKAIVILDFFAHKLEEILPHTEIKHVILTQVGDYQPNPKRQIIQFVLKKIKKMIPDYQLPDAVWYRSTLKLGAKARLSDHVWQRDDVAILQYTGGTTGVAKGAMLTHRNLVANTLQNCAWMAPLLKEGAETIMTPLPLYHVFSLVVNCMTFIHYGGLNVLITNPRDLKAFTREMKKHPFTVLTGVNTLFNGLLNYAPFRQLDLKALKVVVAGGMALQRPIAERWKELTGVQIHEGFGLTECSPVTHCNPLVGENRIGTIGLAFPSTDIKLVDEAGNEVAPGERGELCIMGPQVMKGYWNRPDETALVLKDGWLRTGDVATMDPDGYFRIVDRIKDMILVSGFNVYPNEVEEALAGHPDILECGVIGVPDPESTETVKAYVVKKPGSTLTEEAVKAYAKEVLAGYKCPKYVEFRTELPKTNIGKILRRHLKEA